jgi:fatty-acyl-CoA synthase
MVLPLLTYSQAIIKILQEENITKSKWVPTIWLGVYHAMKENHQRKLALQEYIVGSSALPKSLREVSKRFWDKKVQAWE